MDGYRGQHTTGTNVATHAHTHHAGTRATLPRPYRPKKERDHRDRTLRTTKPRQRPKGRPSHSLDGDLPNTPHRLAPGPRSKPNLTAPTTHTRRPGSRTQPGAGTLTTRHPTATQEQHTPRRPTPDVTTDCGRRTSSAIPKQNMPYPWGPRLHQTLHTAGWPTHQPPPDNPESTTKPHHAYRRSSPPNQSLRPLVGHFRGPNPSDE